MGWFGGGSPLKVSLVTPVQDQPPTQFLEDLPPKFNDDAPTAVPPTTTPISQATLAEAARQFKFSDWSLERLISMSCFREAAITGFQAMGVLGTITFLVHKNPSRLVNWGMCGFFLGTIVGWEQCRLIRRRQFEMMEKARQLNQEKLRAKWDQHEAAADQTMDSFNDFNSKK